VKVGIIGGGAAGLACAWLLDGQHDVTLFERDDRLGGHAHTMEIDVDGRRVSVDAGFQFFGETPAYATFTRLLDLLDVSRRSYRATLTVYDSQRQRPIAMPPVRGGRPVWSSLTPSALGTMIRFRKFLAAVPAFVRRQDTTLTIGEYLQQQHLPRSFVDGFLLPLLVSFWCVDRSEFLRFAAYNALYYLGANMPSGLQAPRQSEIPGGMETYVDALVGELGSNTRLHAGTAIRAIEREGNGYVVLGDSGDRHVFDQVILATNAHHALELIEAVPELEPVCRQLRRFEYFDTTIAIHGDRRLMPRSESAWSVVNVRGHGPHSSLSIWNSAAGVFKSWVSFDDALPEPLYAVATYQHGKVTPAYFDAQRRLKALQGRHGMWLAGLYAHDADSHESAIRSAVTVAQRLAPDSPRLGQLLA
jgi:predicted NAD/FAD-binding protein